MGQKYWPNKTNGAGLEGWKSPRREEVMWAEGGSVGGSQVGVNAAPSDFSTVRSSVL